MPRFTIDVGDKFDRLLTDLARTDETTKSEIVRRALAIYGRLREETDEGNKVAIVDSKHKVLKEVVIP